MQLSTVMRLRPPPAGAYQIKQPPGPGKQSPPWPVNYSAPDKQGEVYRFPLIFFDLRPTRDRTAPVERQSAITGGASGTLLRPGVHGWKFTCRRFKMSAHEPLELLEVAQMTSDHVL
jgi:hypothetical protein